MHVRAGRGRTKRIGMVGLGVVLALCLGSASVTAAQEDVDFAELAAVVEAAGTPDGGEDLLFFPLDESFGDCLPVSAPCPPSSSTVMLVPAAGRRLTWRPEGADLHTVRVDEPPVRAIGTPPERHDSVVYLLPVLDGAGIQLSHAPRRFEAGRLVDAGSDDGPAAGGDSDSGSGNSGADPAETTVTGREAVTPVLAGPLLSTAAPSPAPERILLRPVLVEASEIDDASPVLLARRSAPSRVVFGVRPDPAWGLKASYLPLLDEAVVAVAARHEDQVGLAIPLPPSVDRVAVADRAPRGNGNGRGASPSRMPVLAVGAAVLAGLAGVMLLVRRRRARQRTTTTST